MPQVLYVDGRLVPQEEAHISPLDRGFTLGDGIFTTVRVVDARVFRLQSHLRRLRMAADAIHLKISADDGELTGALERLIAVNGLRDAVLRITLSRGVPKERGLLPDPDALPTVTIQASPFRELPAEKVVKGFSALISGIRRNEHSPTSMIKSCNYLENVLAKIEASGAGADEAIMRNTTGLLACCTSSNLFLVSGRKVRTPALRCGVLPGITREAVAELAARLGIGWEEGELNVDELFNADEAFLTNTVLGIVPITEIDRRQIGTGRLGALAGELRQEYQRLLQEH